MPTLVLRNVPEHLHEKLKAAAAAHHRSMTQEAIATLSTGLGEPLAAKRPSVPVTLAWLQREVWPHVRATDVSEDEILGYGDDGLPR